MLIAFINKIQESYIHLFLISQFVQLLDISPQNFIFLKTFDPEFPDIEKWFADQSFNPLEDFNPIKENKYLATSLIT